VIPFNKPAVAGKELEYIHEAVSRGQLAGDGFFTDKCQSWLAEKLGAPAVLLTHSCTAALEMSAILIGIDRGDEVIMPSFTFVSTANAVVLRGGIPVFVDIRPDTLNIDENLVESAITDRTKAIFPVHYAGIPAQMERILDIAQRNGLYVVEDAAQALGSKYKGRNAGTLAALAAFSFHETKNLISGEGGALAINDPDLIARSEIVREKGTNRKVFFRGEVDKYTWVDIGSSFLPGELVAAYLWGQLEEAKSIQNERMTVWNRYEIAFREFNARGLRTPIIPDDCEHNAHMYYILLPSKKARDQFIALMKYDGITTPFHYVPLHSAPAGRRFGRTSGELSVTDYWSERLVRLPMYAFMGDAPSRVIERARLHLSRLL